MLNRTLCMQPAIRILGRAMMRRQHPIRLKYAFNMGAFLERLSVSGMEKSTELYNEMRRSASPHPDVLSMLIEKYDRVDDKRVLTLVNDVLVCPLDDNSLFKVICVCIKYSRIPSAIQVYNKMTRDHDSISVDKAFRIISLFTGPARHFAAEILIKQQNLTPQQSQLLSDKLVTRFIGNKEYSHGAEFLFQMYNKKNIVPSTNILSKFLYHLGKSTNNPARLDFFHSLILNDRVELSERMLHYMISMLRNADRIPQAIQLWNEKHHLVSPTDMIYNLMVKIYIRMNDIPNALKLFENIKQDFTVEVLITKMMLYEATGQIHKIKLLVRYMDSQNLLNSKIINSAIALLCKHKRYDDIDFILDISKDIKMNVQLLTTIIKIHGQRDVDRMKIFFDRLVEKGLVNSISFTVAIIACCEQKRFDDAIQIYERSMSLNCFSELLFSTVLFHVCKPLKDMEMSIKVFRDAERAGCVTSSRLYENIIFNAIHSSRHDLRDEYAQLADSAGVVLSLMCRVSILCSRNQSKQAFDLIVDSVNASVNFSKDEIPLASLIHLLINQQDADAQQIQSLFDIANERGFSSDIYFWNLYIEFKCNIKEYDQALSIMNDKTHKPNTFTYNTVLLALIKAGRYHDAEGVGNIIKKENIEPNEKLERTLTRLARLIKEGSGKVEEQNELYAHQEKVEKQSENVTN
ncbi:pentatricopeptide repeat-containing protein [Acrasis kona]|uniref:Pentatricopeptide repeat-containing protein n=1 Tax=Acrasis kona TaxID=1008807 RepID=A0AAW2ZA58_9EUKA